MIPRFKDFDDLPAFLNEGSLANASSAAKAAFAKFYKFLQSDEAAKEAFVKATEKAGKRAVATFLLDVSSADNETKKYNLGDERGDRAVIARDRRIAKEKAEKELKAKMLAKEKEREKEEDRKFKEILKHNTVKRDEVIAAKLTKSQLEVLKKHLPAEYMDTLYNVMNANKRVLGGKEKKLLDAIRRNDDIPEEDMIKIMNILEPQIDKLNKQS